MWCRLYRDLRIGLFRSLVGLPCEYRESGTDTVSAWTVSVVPHLSIGTLFFGSTSILTI
jgi:hypothetical protein